MNILKKKKILSIFIIIYLILSSVLMCIINFNQINLTAGNSEGNFTEDKNSPRSPKLSSNAFDRRGKVFTSKDINSLNCYINNEQPSLNNQPSVYVPDYYISAATMNFQNIEASNYTRNIETEPSEFIFSSRWGPIYVYQKFAVVIDQYVNNVSILIQDISDPQNPSLDRFWEVAIVNCTSDGTPNEQETLGLLQKEPPIIFAAHWELFDFKNKGNGPIFLNTSLTNSTVENGITKYWFAIKIKIPPNDYGMDENPKFLYFSQDGGESTNIGEGDTYAESPDFVFANYTRNDVVESNVVNGLKIKGDLNSFKVHDDGNRYLATNDSNSLLNITLRLELNNLTNPDYTYNTLYNKILREGIWFSDWWYEHHRYIYTIDFYLATNVSNTNFVENATLYAWSYGIPNPKYHGGGVTSPDWLIPPGWVNLSEEYEPWFFQLDRPDEDLKHYQMHDPWEKFVFLSFLNGPAQFDPPPELNPKNSIIFKLEYDGTGPAPFNVSIDHYRIEIGEFKPLVGIQKHDPMIQKLHYVTNATDVNGTNIFGKQTIDSLQSNDNTYYRAQADTNNLSIEFNFTIIPELNNTLWEGVDFDEWIISYPYPLIPRVEIRISSNVSFTSFDDLNYSVLEIYKGDIIIPIFPPEMQELDWIQISDDKEFAFKDEKTVIFPLDAGFTWILLQFMDPTTHNVRFRLRYVGNGTFENFNITVDDFKLNFYIQNAISSDIASKIGLGLHNPTLLPQNIEMKIFGTNVVDVDNQTGRWSGSVPGGIPTLGIFEFEVSSLWHAIRFDVKGSCEIYKFEVEIDFKDDLETQYMTGTEHFTVEVTDGLGNPLENLEIRFELRDADDTIVDEDTATTDEDGEAIGSLELEDVGDGFKIKAIYEEPGIYSETDEESDEFRIIDEFTLFMDNFLLLLPYILIGLAALLTFIALRHRKLSKLREFWAGEAIVLDDLLKISYIMIIHKEAGLTIYDQKISLELDSDLIGGFITAISQFKSEIKKPIEKLGADTGFEMDYHDFKIDLVDGDYIRTALILEGAPSEKLKENQRLFTDKFETKFSPLLEDFTGDIKPFKETDALVEEFFNLSFVYPFQLEKNWKLAKLNKLETALLEVAEQMQKERKYFFISNLLNYGLAGRKESKNQIISTLIGLKRRDLLVPVKID